MMLSEQIQSAKLLCYSRRNLPHIYTFSELFFNHNRRNKYILVTDRYWFYFQQALGVRIHLVLPQSVTLHVFNYNSTIVYNIAFKFSNNCFSKFVLEFEILHKTEWPMGKNTWAYGKIMTINMTLLSSALMGNLNTEVNRTPCRGRIHEEPTMILTPN